MFLTMWRKPWSKPSYRLSTASQLADKWGNSTFHEFNSCKILRTSHLFLSTRVYLVPFKSLQIGSIYFIKTVHHLQPGCFGFFQTFVCVSFVWGHRLYVHFSYQVSNVLAETKKNKSSGETEVLLGTLYLAILILLSEVLTWFLPKFFKKIGEIYTCIPHVNICKCINLFV